MNDKVYLEMSQVLIAHKNGASWTDDEAKEFIRNLKKLVEHYNLEIAGGWNLLSEDDLKELHNI